MRRILLGLLTAFIAGICYLLYDNNRDASRPDEQTLRAHHEKAVGWMQDNREHILTSTNHILWWMVMRSADITQDPRLQALYAEYKQHELDAKPNLIWQHYFNRHSFVPVVFTQLTGLPDYNQFFVYGMTCDRELAQLDIIKQQLEEDFCPEHHPLSPACVTHQLMGARFMLDRGCGNVAEVNRLIGALQDKIVTQLTWDPRVVDVYLQRVLMLTESGATERIKPIWIRRAVEAQLDDGGWGVVQPFIHFGPDSAFGFTARGIGISSTQSDFHATAQGLLLLSLLLHPEKP